MRPWYLQLWNGVVDEAQLVCIPKGAVLTCASYQSIIVMPLAAPGCVSAWPPLPQSRILGFLWSRCWLHRCLGREAGATSVQVGRASKCRLIPPGCPAGQGDAHLGSGGAQGAETGPTSTGVALCDSGNEGSVCGAQTCLPR